MLQASGILHVSLTILLNDRRGPECTVVTGISESPAKGDLDAGKTVAFTLAFSEPVTVAGGTPTLTLNDGGTATYASGSGGKTLTFDYTVAAGQNTTSLAATAVHLPSGATIKDSAGNAAKLSLDRPGPEGAADRHGKAGGDVGSRLAGEGNAIPWRFDNHHGQNERGSHDRWWETDARLERRRRRDLRERVRH